jgi:SNF2 family DNA or RNA helicase
LLDPSQIIIPLLNYSDQDLIESEEVFYDPIQLEHYTVEFSLSGFRRIIRELRQRNFDDLDWHRLAQTADELSLTHGFSELLCVSHLAERWQQVGVIPYPHQIKTAEKVLREMRGQAILADEVGLGKTIEAGIILKEYLLRGLVKRALILVPASLCWQWYQELYEKFDIQAGIQKSEWDWEHADILIASLDTAKREPHAEIIKNIPYDMLIIDEAHKLKNNNTAAWKFVNSIQKKYCLMLTATPVQNNLKELYNLITLLKPGQLGSYRKFKQRFMLDLRTPKNPEELRKLLSSVLIRNRRGEGTVQFTKRNVYPILVELSPEEKALYDRITNLIKASSKLTPFQSNILPLITLQREVCSSFYAAGLTLQKIYQKHNLDSDSNIVQLMNETVKIRHNSKCDIIEKLAAEIQDRIIIFTEYRASQEYIRYRLEKAGFRTLAFDGSLSRGRKQWIRYIFQKEGGILVSTESGGEGLNFQFCNHVINYDLPWNPMRLEQRIGRVHRLGQTKDVHIYNLVTKDTIEEHIMFLLHEKINMFQMVLGELDTILMHLKWDKSFESQLMDIFLKYSSRDEIQRELDLLGERILETRSEIKKHEWNIY